MAVRASLSRARATALILAVAVSIVVEANPASALTSGIQSALPPPPPNPSNGEITAAQGAASAKAGAVGRITSQLATAQASLQNLQDQIELKEEDANKAMVDLQAAQNAASAAQAGADSAKVAADAANAQIDALRQQTDQFVAGSFEQGSELGSAAAYLSAGSADQLLEREQLLTDLSGSQLDVLNQFQVARTAKANADSLARAALLVAQQKQADAVAAKHTADAAVAAAVAAQRAEAAQQSQLQATQNSLEQQLSAAQATVGDLKSQRAQYQNWLAAKQAADAAAAAAAARNTTSSTRSSARRVLVAASGDVGAVIQRALAEIGVTYAWGGGTASGPSRGIHDGGVADSYGDYDRIGFDCSGLMVYAFAGAGVSLPHFSGYQYQAGQHVPLSDIQPGDLLFWSFDGTAGGIHHVALYIGGGMMIEAYESGTAIRVTSVRYYDGIMPYATRLL
ncbi:MAG TPA: NlpC/P60 family protein [Pseudonocardiaceae bacterium]|jgi:cell wall-associated NlpC family hydrolase|nr:NlpC/P60 family protein [Pseudonocardiaceae bacterium]